MAGNTYGHLFRVTTFGESHGPAIGVIVDGVPPRVDLTEEDIQVELNRRRPGQSAITTQRQEADRIEILSGIFEGKTTGTPLALLIRNTDARSKDYSQLKDKFRPGHADFSFESKFGIRDWRGGGRSSGRETATRVAAGAVAKKILGQRGVRINAYTLAVGGIQANQTDFSQIEKNAVRCPDPEAALKMIDKIEAVRKEGDSLGGIIEAVVQGCPAGLGDPVFDKLEARLASAILSIGTIKGVEFGLGFGSAHLKGSEYNDAFTLKEGKIRTATNHAGGIQGGISNGENIVLRAVVRPTSSISKVQQTVNKVTHEHSTIEVEGRHDPCICPRVVPVIEAMIALTLMDCLLIQESIQAGKV